MKKKKFVFAALLFLTLLSVGASAAILEDFESIADWVEDTSGGAWSVQNTVAVVGNAGRLATDGAGDSAYGRITRTFNGENSFGWYFRTDNVTNSSFFFHVDDDDAAHVTTMNIINGSFSVNHGGGSYNFTQTISADIWYYVYIAPEDGNANFKVTLYNSGLTPLEDTGKLAVEDNNFGLNQEIQLAGRDMVASTVNYYFDELGTPEFAQYIYAPPTTVQTTDLNTSIELRGNCASYDVNMLNIATGQDDNLFWSGVLLDSARDENNFVYFPQSGQQTLRLESYCVSQDSRLNSDYNITFDLYDFNATVAGTLYDGNTYLSNVDYNLTYTCGALDQDVDVNLLLDDVLVSQITDINCNAAAQEVTGSYTPLSEGITNIKLRLDAVVDADNNTFFDVNYYVDTNAPNVLAFDVNNSHGFFASDTATTWVICDDLISPKINYYITLNDANIFDELHDQNTLQTTDLDLNHGTNDFNYTCVDLAGNSASDNNNLTIYSQHYALIDEDDRNAFDTSNCTSLIAYALDTNQFYDFIAEGTSNVFYFSPVEEAVRFEFIYDNAGVDVQVDREFNVSLLDDLNINVCAAKLQAFYQQVFLSTSVREVIALNNYANCYLTASNTTYAYSNIFSLATYTIDKPYYLYTTVAGTRVLLALLDGARATEINLDMLIYAAAELDLRVVSDELSIASLDENTFVIYFESVESNLTSVDLDVYDGSTVVWSYTENTSPEKFTVFFNHGGMDFNADLMHIVLTKNYADGSTEEITEYFTPQSASGLLHPTLAVIFAVLLMIMALSFVSRSIAFGWFGLIICCISLAILAFAEPVWYVRFFQAITVIIIIFIALGFKAETSKVI